MFNCYNVIMFSDVIEIDYNAMVSFGFHQKCFSVVKVRIMESFDPKGHENYFELRRLLYYRGLN